MQVTNCFHFLYFFSICYRFLTFLFIYKEYHYWVWNLSGWFFSFSPWKMAFLWHAQFLLMNSLPFPSQWGTLSLSLLSRFFSLAVAFKVLSMMCLGVAFFGFSNLGFTQFLESVDVRLLLILRTIQALLLWILVKHHPLFSPLQELW